MSRSLERSAAVIAPRSSAQHGCSDAYADVIADLRVTVSTKVAHRKNLTAAMVSAHNAQLENNNAQRQSLRIRHAP
ncbi:hypothetical protein PSEUDO9AZ_11512 [Pseudomonas sp. 9AZ]|nr:hypothetical protein PSEUDO9AZ_11512 [Pseudomonas sp. 9AZ]